MATTGLGVFDETLQITNMWLDDIQDEIGPDRQRAYHALRAVLHALRDRLTVEQAAHLSAQLPMLVRGIFFEGWHPAGKPEKLRSLDEFLARVSEELQGIRPMGAGDAARAVLRALSVRLPRGEIDQVRGAMPEELQQFWPQGERPHRQQRQEAAR